MAAAHLREEPTSIAANITSEFGGQDAGAIAVAKMIVKPWSVTFIGSPLPPPSANERRPSGYVGILLEITSPKPERATVPSFG